MYKYNAFLLDSAAAQSTASHHGDPGSAPGQSMQNIYKLKLFPLYNILPYIHSTVLPIPTENTSYH
jgi:hypothetical protein